MRVAFLELAKTELDDAIIYYETQQPGLGGRLRREVLSSISRIVEFPTAYQKFGMDTRRCLVAHFPYGIIYHHRSDEDELLILAIAHLHRRPDYWTSRSS